MGFYEIYLIGTASGFAVGFICPFFVGGPVGESDVERAVGHIGIGLVFAGFWFVAVPLIVAGILLKLIGMLLRAAQKGGDA